MDKQDKIRLLQMQEHPENYTDEKLRQLLDDDSIKQLKEELSQAKRAVTRHDAEDKYLPIDELWQSFAEKHSDELDRLDKDNAGNLAEKSTPHIPFAMRFRRIAAIFLVIVCITGIAFAAGVKLGIISNPFVKQEPVLYRPTNNGKIKDAEHRFREGTRPAPAKHTDAESTKTEPMVFDNVTLETMLGKIASHYKVEVEFKNEEARSLRFYFEWKQDESLNEVIRRLNLFQSINIVVEDNKIKVE